MDNNTKTAALVLIFFVFLSVMGVGWVMMDAAKKRQKRARMLRRRLLKNRKPMNPSCGGCGGGVV